MTEKESKTNNFNIKLEWLDGTCYRIYENKVDNSETTSTEPTETDLETTDDQKLGSGDSKNVPDTKKSDVIDIKQIDNDHFQTSIEIPQKFYSRIIGTKDTKRKQLETDTHTEIKIPNEKKDKKVLITGATANDVISARRKLEVLSNDLRKNYKITHFISYPLNCEEIKNNFTEFKKSLLSDESITGIDETLFMKTDKLHLTIGILVLLDKDEVQEAADVLQKMKNDIIQPHFLQNGPLSLHIKGLQIMNSDPSRVDVLYANVHVVGKETNQLIQDLSDKIVEYFHEHGLMKKEKGNVKLHATLLNSRYRRERSPVKGKRPKRMSFDAGPIIEKYGDYDFGKQEFSTIHLSDRGSTDKNGYYGCEGLITVGAE